MAIEEEALKGHGSLQGRIGGCALTAKELSGKEPVLTLAEGESVLVTGELTREENEMERKSLHWRICMRYCFTRFMRFRKKKKTSFAVWSALPMTGSTYI